MLGERETSSKSAIMMMQLEKCNNPVTLHHIIPGIRLFL